MRQMDSLKKWGVGLGLRRSFLHQVAQELPSEIDWFEFAPENYIDRGGQARKSFNKIAENYPLIAHGLSLSIGSLDELNWDYLKKLKQFLKDYDVPWFSDHLCFQSYEGSYFHDLLPLPFTEESILHVSERAKQVQDFLDIPFAIENVSFYFYPEQPEMKETEFIKEILNRAGIGLLLDVNNVFVNSKNHRYRAVDYLNEIKDQNIFQIHIAGHYQEDEDLIIDTHGEAICDEVWELLNYFSQQRELPPVLIERDHNIPPLQDLIQEVQRAKEIYLK